MRKICIRSLSLAALAFLAFAGTLTAQDRSSAILNTVEVQQLVKRGEPGDEARLSAHFTALAERYDAEARRHTSMAQTYMANATRMGTMAAGMSAHADHRALEEYFLTLAKRYSAEADQHAATAATYRGTKIALAAHCDRLVALSRDEAKEATAAAAMHKQLAGVAK